MDMFSRTDQFLECGSFLDTVASTLELNEPQNENSAIVTQSTPIDSLNPPVFNNLLDYLGYARRQNASDFHISANVKPFMRRFGQIQFLDVNPLSPEETQRIFFDVLSEEQKTLLLRDHSLEFSMDIPGQGRYRCSIVRERLGWDGSFRIIQNKVPSFEGLGLPESLRRLTEYQQGLVLVTGPVNSGKTTTLAALLDTINENRSDHIITIEKPIEYVHVPKKCQVTQREVGRHTESFSEALRAALRQDPDVIMVGELHDLQTLAMAISASETGHLVFGTLHTTSAARTINKILDGFPISKQAQVRAMVSESLRGIISQLLIPRQDGQGLALAIEILFVSTGIAALLRENKTVQIPSVMQTSRKMGMCLMDDSLQALVDSGTIDGTMAYYYAEDKSRFEFYRPEILTGNRPVVAQQRI